MPKHKPLSSVRKPPPSEPPPEVLEAFVSRTKAASPSQTSMDVHERPETSMDVYERLGTSTDVPRRPESESQLFDSSQTSVDVYERPETSMDVHERLETSVNVHERSQTSKEFLERRPSLSADNGQSSASRTSQSARSRKRPQTSTDAYEHPAKSIIKRDKGERRRMTVYLPPELAGRLANYCQAEGRELSATITKALTRFLDSEPG